MSTLRATNIKNPDSGNNNIVLDGSGGVIISGVTTSSSFVGNVTGNVSGNATGLSGTPNLNVGVVTASSFVGNVTGNATGLSGTPNIVLGIATVSAGSTSAPSITPSGDPNTGVFFPSADTIAFAEGGTEVARFDSSGRFGLGTNNPVAKLQVDGTTTITAGPGNSTANGLHLYFSSNIGVISGFNDGVDYRDVILEGKNLRYQISGSEKARIDSSGRLLVGTNTARANFYNGSATYKFQIEGVSGGEAGIAIVNNANATFGSQPRLILAKAQGVNLGSNGVLGSEDVVGDISFQGSDGTEFVEAARIRCEIDAGASANDMPGRLVFFTTADGASSPTERMRIKESGAIRFGPTGGVVETYYTFLRTGVSEATLFGIFYNNVASTLQMLTVQSDGFNAANTALKIGRNSSTSRSINAGGTVNASGADYAEYMVKDGDFEIAKGDVCGVKADGKLTNIFANAVGFLVKSTNPSYVGGDTWGTEDAIGAKPDAGEPELVAEWEAALESERQKVDRIAFAGQVPVNVTGATPGQYIVPVATEEGGIAGIAKNEADLTLTEYMRAVGKVIAIEEDGRARIIVKVA